MLIDKYSTKDEIPENLRSEYIEVNGEWVLDGYVKKGKLDEFRTNNRTLAKEREELQTQLLKFKDIDPKKYAESVAKLQELENNRLAEAGEWKVLKTNMEQFHSEAIKAANDKTANVQNGWNADKVGNYALTAVAKLAVVAGLNGKYVQQDMMELFSVNPETNEIVMIDGKGLIVKNKAGDGNLTMDEYLKEEYIPKSSLFQKSEGAGSIGGAGDFSIQKGQVKSSDINGANLSTDMIDKIASGEIEVVD